MAAATRPISELLLATRSILQEHLSALSRQSQNKTAALFSQLYRGQAARAHAPLAALYDDIRSLLRPGADGQPAEEAQLGARPPEDLAHSTGEFFKAVFPVAFQNVLRLDTRRFTAAYEACLKDAVDAVAPFGDIPQHVGASLARSLEAARALLRVLGVGASVLRDAERAAAGAVRRQCAPQLLRLAGCSRCQGHDVSPCKNFCLNVARGCVGATMAELEAPWAGFVEAVERLARADADAALRALDAGVSEAIMHALENHVTLEKKVRQQCGPPATEPGAPPAPPPSAAPRRDALRAPPPDSELLQFAAALAATRRLFASLADRLCDQPAFAADADGRCWNGDAVSEYTKALVASAATSDQKYNPEVAEGAADAQVALLGERLRQARQALGAHSWGGGAAAEAFMQGDEAGDEGSGSGRLYTDDDAAYDAEGSGDEGSGTPDLGSRAASGEEPASPAPPAASAAPALGPPGGLALLALAAALGR